MEGSGPHITHCDHFFNFIHLPSQTIRPQSPPEPPEPTRAHTLYGVSDETHQFFVAAGQADVMAGVADFAGSVLCAIIYMKIAYRQGL